MPRTKIPITRTKKIKKIKQLKTKRERLEFSDSIKLRFAFEFGISEKEPSIATFYKIMDEWIETGQSVSGKLPFPEAPFGGRIIQYVLSNRKHIQ